MYKKNPEWIQKHRNKWRTRLVSHVSPMAEPEKPSDSRFPGFRVGWVMRGHHAKCGGCSVTSERCHDWPNSLTSACFLIAVA